MHRIHSANIVVLPLALFLGLAPWNAQAQTYFYNQATFPTGNYPTGVAIADFNGDGRMDMAITNYVDNTVSILLGKPDGTFAAKTDFPVANGPQQVVVGDFNGDGKIDLAIATYSATVSILLGNGDGTFQGHVDYPTSGISYFLTVADFNHDGKVDLAVTNNSCSLSTCSPGSVSILLGNGDGTFQAKTDYALPASPGSVIAADFNGDGNLDLAVLSSNFNGNSNGSLWFVSILLGNGDGTFQPHVDYPTLYASSGVAAADFNGDGKPDLVVVAEYPEIFLGNGDGTFQAGQQIPTTNGSVLGSYGVLAADFNHDGKMDFVIANVFVNGASVFLGNGDGTFQPEVDYMAIPGQGAMATADVNGDGALDVVLTNGDYKTATVLLGNGDGTFSPRVPAPALPPIQSISWTAGTGLIRDINGDGKLGLIVNESNQAYLPSEEAVVIFPGNGDGTFGTPVINDLASTVVATADFNGDGKADLVLSNGNGAGIALGNGDGTFGSVIQFFTDYGGTPRGVVTGDFNSDGKTDVAISQNGSSTTPPIIVFLSNGDGTFRSVPFSANGTQIPLAIAAADFNGDGRADLAVCWDLETNNLAVYLGKGDGTFQSPVFYTTDSLAQGIAVADFNGDGVPDLVTTGNTANVFLGNGDGTFKSPAYFNAGSFPEYVVTGDFNGDGKVDLAIADDLYLSILLGNGDGTFQPPVSVNDSSYSYTPAAGDLNQDGVTDLFIGSGTGSLFLSRPLTSFSPALLNFAPQAVGTESLPLTLTITNVGTGALSFSNVVTMGEFGTTNNCSGNVSRGGACTLDVTFMPTSSGTERGTITFTDNTTTGSQVIPLSGFAGVPAAKLSTSSLTFASQLVGTESGAQTVTLTNSGTLALAIVNIAASGDFTQTNTCESTLNAGASCAISVTFTPTAGGVLTGFVTVTDNAIGSPQSVTLTGTGAEPIVSLSSPPTFSSQLVGSTSSSQTVTLTNTGSASLTLTAIGATGPFAIAASGTTCSTSNTVAAAATCTVAITFTPTAEGSSSGSLSFTDNAPNSPQTVALVGTGQDFSFAAPSGSSTSATVAPGSPATYTLSLGGEGGLSGTVNFTCTGAPSEATCAVSPNPATLGSAATNITVTITTAAPSSTAPLSRPLPPVAPLSPGAKNLLMLGLVLAAMAWAVKHRNQPASRGHSMMALLAAGLLLTLALAGCGGGGGGGGGPAPNPGTPAGTYTVTVTGTTGSGSTALSHTVTFTLIVS